MAQMNLDPQAGVQLAEGFTQLVNDKITGVVVACFQAAKEVCDGTAMFDGIKANFERFQAYYNDEAVPVINRGKDSFEEYTNMANYLKNLQVENAVNSQDCGTITENEYDIVASI